MHHNTGSTDGIGVALADRSSLLTALAPVRAACRPHHRPSIIDHPPSIIIIMYQGQKISR
jgi:hypothetical protein